MKRYCFNRIVAKNEVAPFTGAWIETKSIDQAYKTGRVAPFTGAWIETAVRWNYPADGLVAPFTGAWIETVGVARGHAS